MPRLKKKDYFNELYFVKLNYQLPEGYWKMGHIEEVMIPAKHGRNEKNNHDQAVKIAKERYPGCEIISITYA